MQVIILAILVIAIPALLGAFVMFDGLVRAEYLDNLLPRRSDAKRPSHPIF